MKISAKKVRSFARKTMIVGAVLLGLFGGAVVNILYFNGIKQSLLSYPGFPFLLAFFAIGGLLVFSSLRFDAWVDRKNKRLRESKRAALICHIEEQRASDIRFQNIVSATTLD